MSEPLLRVDNLYKHYPFTKGILLARRMGEVKAVDGISFAIAAGKTLGLVGESGCGKSTLSRTVMQLIAPTGGRVILNGEELTLLSASEVRHRRIDFQMIFQDPYASLNPRMTVFSTLAEALRTRQPHLAGGELLDVSIQSQILNLLKGLVSDLNLTMIFISHDLSVVRYIADRIAVMHFGKIVELGESEELMEKPSHDYTRELLAAIPRIRDTP